MPITINGSGTITGVTAGGYPDASVNTEDLNAGTASTGQKLVAAGASGAMTWGSSIVLGTPQNSTSGTSIDFTGIPSWARRITVMFNGVSTNGTSQWLVQLGAGSVQSSGYLSYPIYVNAGALSNISGSTSGIVVASASGANTAYGSVVFGFVSSNSWVANGALTLASNTSVIASGGVTLSGTLDRVRITTVNGTDTFDAGSINIQFE